MLCGLLLGRAAVACIAQRSLGAGYHPSPFSKFAISKASVFALHTQTHTFRKTPQTQVVSVAHKPYANCKTRHRLADVLAGYTYVLRSLSYTSDVETLNFFTVASPRILSAPLWSPPCSKFPLSTRVHTAQDKT
eukprot:150665-Rhodomonas_salina.1